jgi:hypothetical protein
LAYWPIDLLVFVMVTPRVFYEVSTNRSKAVPVTGRGGPYGREKSRLSHFLESRLIDGGEVVSLKRRSPLTPRKIPGIPSC